MPDFLRLLRVWCAYVFEKNFVLKKRLFCLMGIMLRWITIYVFLEHYMRLMSEQHNVGQQRDTERSFVILCGQWDRMRVHSFI